ncbi:MAG: LuxR C-terminal-related transcriptional regulator [Syntrophorhabdales bacterium]
MQASFPLNAALGVFRVLFEEITNTAMNLLNKDHTVLWANKGMARLVQRDLNEMTGKPCYQAFRRREEPCPTCLLKIVSETKQPYVVERWLDLPNQERQYAEVRAYPILDNRGFVQYLFEILTPTTGQKKDEERRAQYIESLEKTLRELTIARTEVSAQMKELTVREEEVLRLITRGFSNKEIAQVLGMSLDTAKTHVKNIFSKLRVTDRTEAAVWAFMHKLI